MEKGEQVVVISPDGNLAQGWVMAGGYSNHHEQPSTNPDITAHHFSDGAIIRYNRKTHNLQAVLPEGATTELVSPGGVHIIGAVKITGGLSVTDNINSAKDITDKTRSMAADRGIYNEHANNNHVPPAPNQ